MAKKAELLEQAKAIGLDVTEKNTVAEIEDAINNTGADQSQAEEAPAEDTSSEATEATEEELKLAKSGKRSAKGLAEAEAKAEKIDKQQHRDDEEAEQAPKPMQKPARSRIERSGKKLRTATEKVEKGKEYGAKEAVALATETSTTSFDATVELHVRLNVDPKHADQNIRETIVLPEGTGKSVRVAVFAEADDVATAKKAGADIAGAEEFLQQLDKGTIDFDVLIATPSVMAKLGKYARLLGPKGLMPNPKSGTVTPDVTKAVEQAKAGKVELRVDETGIVHLGIGKVSFGADRLLANTQAVFSALKGAKPSSIKGTFVQSIYMTTSMGPSIKIASSEL